MEPCLPFVHGLSLSSHGRTSLSIRSSSSWLSMPRITQPPATLRASTTSVLDTLAASKIGTAGRGELELLSSLATLETDLGIGVGMSTSTALGAMV